MRLRQHRHIRSRGSTYFCVNIILLNLGILESQFLTLKCMVRRGQMDIKNDTESTIVNSVLEYAREQTDVCIELNSRISNFANFTVHYDTVS